MDNKQSKNEESIYHEVLSKSPSERAEYLKKICQGDTALQARVEDLLKSRDEAGDFLETPLFSLGSASDSTFSFEKPGTMIGSYKLIEKLGEGGMAVVYMAKQEQPICRNVALKILKPGMESKQVISRFAAEKQTLAMMNHSNIAKVHDAGVTEGGRPYFVMEHVDGRPVTKYCDEHKLSLEKRLVIFKQICEGVQHAHQKGIIHRDIKPSNILVYNLGSKAIPKIIDFGVAKAMTEPILDNQSFTRHGQLVGTPEYMSPEQVDMATQDIDIRTDIYSLGVLLYELLAGVLPYEKELFENGFNQIQRTIQQEEPATPSTKLTGLGDKAKEIAEYRRTQLIPLARCLQRELEWIPMKAMRKDRTRRYRSASEFSDDIQNYLTGAPLIAGPESSVYRVRKFVRKHAGSVTAAVLIALTILLGLVISIVMGCRAEHARKEEVATRMRLEQALRRAEVAEKLAKEKTEDHRRALYFKSIALAELSYRDGEIRRVREQLDACPEDLRAWEWNYLDYLSDHSIMTFEGLSGSKLGISSDGKYLTSGGEENTVKVWDAATGMEVISLQGHTDWVNNASFSPDGKRIVSGSSDFTIRVWDLEDARELLILKGHTSNGGGCFTPDGNRIVTGNRDGTIKIWDAESGAELNSWRACEEGGGRCHAVSPDGKFVAFGSGAAITLWDTISGEQSRIFRGHQGTVFAVNFSPDGKWLVSGSSDLTIKVWNVATAEVQMTLSGHLDRVEHVTFDPLGQRLASCSRDGTVKLWDIQTGKELRNLLGHKHFVKSVVFSPDGKRLFSASRDETIKVWDVSEQSESSPQLVGVSAATFSRDWQYIAVGDSMGKIILLDRASGSELMTLHGPKGDMITELQFSPNGQHLFSSQIRKGTVWNVATGGEELSFSGSAGYVRARFSPNGQYIATWVVEYWDEGHEDDSITVREASTGKALVTLEGHEAEIWDMAFSQDSHSIVSCDIDETVILWDITTGKNIAEMEHEVGNFSVAISPDGKLVASGGSDGDKSIILWDTETCIKSKVLKGHFLGVTQLIFSLDGKRLLSEGRDGTVKLWDVSTGSEVMSFPEASLISLSHDNKTIALHQEGKIKYLRTEKPTDGYGSM